MEDLNLDLTDMNDLNHQIDFFQMPDYLQIQMARQNSSESIADSRISDSSNEIITSDQIPLSSVKNGVCPICVKEFKDNSTALRHFKNAHCSKKPCPYCYRRLRIFGRPDIMRNHLIRCDVYKQLFINFNDDQIKESARVEGKRIYNEFYEEKNRRKTKK